MKEDLTAGLKKLQEAVNNTQHNINVKADFSLIKPTGFSANNMEIYKELIENVKRLTTGKNNKERFFDFITDDMAVPLELKLLQTKSVITKEMALYLDFIGIDLRNFVVDKGNLMFPLYYKDGIFFYRFIHDYNVLLDIIASASNTDNNDRNEVNDFFAKQFIHMTHQLVEVYELFQSKDYMSYLAHIDKPFKFWAFQENLETFTNELTANQFVELFVYVYTRSEYGFDDLDWNDIEWRLKDITESSEYHPKSVLNHLNVDEDGCIQIYRGEGLKSTNIEKARSWTWDLSVAKKFAKRFNDKGEGLLHTAKVYVGDILLCIGGGEKELLVDYDDIELIESTSI